MFKPSASGKNGFVEEILIKTDNVSVRVLGLKPGEALPWHTHSEVTDYIFALEDEIEIQLRSPDESALLRPGQRYKVSTGRIHRVVNRSQGDNSYLLIQGVGKYDFRKAGN